MELYMKNIMLKMVKSRNILQDGTKMRKKLGYYSVNSLNYLVIMETQRLTFSFPSAP